MLTAIFQVTVLIRIKVFGNNRRNGFTAFLGTVKELALSFDGSKLIASFERWSNLHNVCPEALVRE